MESSRGHSPHGLGGHPDDDLTLTLTLALTLAVTLTVSLIGLGGHPDDGERDLCIVAGYNRAIRGNRRATDAKVGTNART